MAYRQVDTIDNLRPCSAVPEHGYDSLGAYILINK